MAGQSQAGIRLGLSSLGAPILSRGDEAGRGCAAPSFHASQPPGRLWSPQHPLTPQFRAPLFPFGRNAGPSAFLLPPSRPRHTVLGAPCAAVSGPAACGPLGRPFSRAAAPYPSGCPCPSGRPHRPLLSARPPSVPAFSAPPSQRLEVGPSPCKFRRAMSRGPGLGPEPRLVAEPKEDAAAASGPSAGSAGEDRLGQPAAHRRVGVPTRAPPPRWYVTVLYAGRATVAGVRAQAP